MSEPLTRPAAGDEVPGALLPAIRQALLEDLGDGDVTTTCTVDADVWIEGRFLAKQEGVVAGLDVAAHVFRMLDERAAVTRRLGDGAVVRAGDVFATVSGPARALLSGERVALNFLQRMSGIATLTRQFVDAVRGTGAVILDTRKTAPGLRAFDKWAVRLGGAANHRIGLFDMALIKENHIAAAGGRLTTAVERVRAGDARARPIEVEVRTIDELREALGLAVDRILLDNMSEAQMRQAVGLAAGRVPLEASGNMSLDTVRRVAETGVTYISVGALTHSPRALDISLLLDPPIAPGRPLG